jgi:Domain of unknown function (DUF4253)
MNVGELPGDGELRLGSLTLPEGRRVAARSAGKPVAWVTVPLVRDVGRLWSAAWNLHPQTGLAPIVLVEPATELFDRPSDLAALERLSAADVLTDLWEDVEEEEIDEYWLEQRSPFGRRFPGLAAAVQERATDAQLRNVLGSLSPARLGLVPAMRPADVLPLVGWFATDAFENALPFAAVLRSWEGRFGARLLRVGPSAEIQLLVERPPHTAETAQALAAEHFAFCDEWHAGDQGLTTVSEIANVVIGAPAWCFWWD